MRLLVSYWGVLLCVLLVLILLAAVDVCAITRYGLRHHRRLRADHRADLERDVARFRQQRNGHL
jgi:hypothetical protein